LITAGAAFAAERSNLVENLRRFDLLPAEQRVALRDLDAALRAAPEADRIRLENLMRRHAAWLSTLPEPRRRQLDAATPEQRLALIERWRDESRGRPLTPPAFDNAIQVSTVATESIRRTALDLRLWFALDASRRAAILAEPNEAAQLALYRTALRANPATARVRDEARRAFGLEPADLRDRIETRRLDRLRSAAFRVDQNRRILDLKAIRDLNSDDVSTETVRRFEAAMPEWVRRTLDPFSPDAARRRLALLYRLVDPAPAEMP
jgi:hypothetical protein